MKVSFLIGLLAFVIWAVGCGGGTASSPSQGQNFKLTSTAFSEGGTIPQKYTCYGQDVSPPLMWSGVPSGTKSFVLIVTDLDAPGGNFTHWVVYDIPSTQTMLNENFPKTAQTGSIKQAYNDFGTLGYGGPCPPLGDPPHRYVFKLYALNVDTLNLQGGATLGQVENAMRGKVISQASLMGKY